MFNFNLPTYLYCAPAVSNGGFHFEQRYLPCPIIPTNPYLNSKTLAIQDEKILKYGYQEGQNTSMLSKLDSIFGDKSNIWKSPQRMKKISKDKSEKIDHNNVYLSFAVHKMFNFVEEIAFSEKILRALIKKWMESEEGI